MEDNPDCKDHTHDLDQHIDNTSHEIEYCKHVRQRLQKSYRNLKDTIRAINHITNDEQNESR